MAGGFLAQGRDNAVVDDMTLKVVTEARADDARAGGSEIRLSRRQAREIQRDRLRQGRGDGRHWRRADVARRQSSRIAAAKAEEAAQAAGLSESLAKGSVVASDAFFPFPDGLLAAAAAGATAVIQPGGSVNDKDVIAAADAGLAMVFTGVRHFRH